MHKLEELKELLTDELEEYGGRTKIDAQSLDIIDKLAHTIKNIDKIMSSKDHEMSYARTNPRRDAMGRYSKDGYSMAADDVADELRAIMKDVKDEHTKTELRQAIHRIEQM